MIKKRKNKNPGSQKVALRPSGVLLVLVLPVLCLSFRHTSGSVSSAFLNLAVSAMIRAHHDVSSFLAMLLLGAMPALLSPVPPFSDFEVNMDSTVLCVPLVLASNSVVPMALSFRSASCIFQRISDVSVHTTYASPAFSHGSCSVCAESNLFSHGPILGEGL